MTISEKSLSAVEATKCLSAHLKLEKNRDIWIILLATICAVIALKLGKIKAFEIFHRSKLAQRNYLAMNKRKIGSIDSYFVVTDARKECKREESETSQNEVRAPDFDLTKLKPFPCKVPKFKDQFVLQSNGVVQLDDIGNSIGIRHNFLSPLQIAHYLEGAAAVTRVRGKTAYNADKPRSEVCYTVDGKPFVYSKHEHFTTKFPPHIIQFLPYMQEAILQLYPHTPYQCISHAADMVYGPFCNRGGSAGTHSDAEKDWGLVAIFSLGQTRYLRVKKKPDGVFYNVELKHNSLVCMHGKDFQRLYTHQVDKLMEKEAVYYRLSFNVRFLEGPNNYGDLLT